MLAEDAVLELAVEDIVGKRLILNNVLWWCNCELYAEVKRKRRRLRRRLHACVNSYDYDYDYDGCYDCCYARQWWWYAAH